MDIKAEVKKEYADTYYICFHIGDKKYSLFCHEDYWSNDTIGELTKETAEEIANAINERGKIMGVLKAKIK